MPPKGWKKYPDGFKPGNAAGTPAKQEPARSMDELLMPRAVVSRIAKEATDNAALPKDGVTALQRSATTFISYLTYNANRECQRESRRVITVQDVQRALEALGFGSFWGEIEKALEAEGGSGEAPGAPGAPEAETAETVESAEPMTTT